MTYERKHDRTFWLLIRWQQSKSRIVRLITVRILPPHGLNVRSIEKANAELQIMVHSARRRPFVRRPGTRRARCVETDATEAALWFEARFFRRSCTASRTPYAVGLLQNKPGITRGRPLAYTGFSQVFDRSDRRPS